MFILKFLLKIDRDMHQRNFFFFPCVCFMWCALCASPVRGCACVRVCVCVLRFLFNSEMFVCASVIVFGAANTNR